MPPRRVGSAFDSNALAVVLVFAALILAVFPAVSAEPPAPSAEPPAFSVEPKAVRIEGVSPLDADRLEKSGLDVTFQGRGWIEALATAQDLEALNALDLRWIPLDRDLIPGARQPNREGNLDAEYHTYLEMLFELQTLEESYPQICKLYDVGDALSKNYTWDNYAQHYDIWGLRISDNPDLDEPEPGIVYDARHHAREPVSTEIVLAVARHFCQRYAVDAQIRQVVNSTEIWIVPMMNPDGHQWVQDRDPWWRKTLHDHDGDHHVDSSEGIDPNRNYDWHWALESWFSEVYGGPSPWSAPETASLAGLFFREKPAINPSFHSYGEVVLYPFGYGIPSEPAVIEVATQYASMIGYHPEQSTTASGSSKDWLYGTVGCASFTVETAAEFIPTGAEMLQEVAQVLPGSVWLASRLWGPSIQGQVTDLLTGLPVEATLHIPEIQDVHGNGELHDMITEAATGYYCRVRPSAPGDITLEVSAPGYVPQSIEVTTGGLSATVRNVQLVPESGSVAADGEREPGISISAQQPYTPGSRITLSSVEARPDLSVNLFDLQGRRIRTLFFGAMDAGPLALQWDGRTEDGVKMRAGLYFLVCRSGLEQRSRKIVLID